MIFDALFLPVYCILISVIGLGFKRLSLKLSGVTAASSETWLLLLFGQFAIGMIALVVNFFTGVNHPITFVLIFLIFLLGIIDIRSVNYKDYLIMVLISVFLVPLAAGMKEGYDGGLYHLPHQLWIRNEKIVFGLANFHGRFGFSSIQEYISAPQWLNEHFKLLSYSTVIYPIAFLLFLWNWLSQKENYKIVLTGLLILNILAFNSYMKWYYTHTDNSSGFLFVLSLLFGFQLVRNSSPGVNNIEYGLFVLIFLAVFSWFLKLSGIVSMVWVLYVFFVLLKRKLIRISILRVLSFFSLIAAIWFVKGVITTGCLLYPVAQSCIDVPWSAKLRAVNDSKYITAWARHPETHWYSLETFDWLENWWLNNYRHFLKNFRATFLGLALLAVVLQISFARRYRFDHSKLAGFLILIISLTLWFFKAPAPRFGTGVFLIFPAFFAFLLLDENYLKISLQTLAKYALKPALLLLIIFSFGWNRLTSSRDSLLSLDGLKVITPEVTEDTLFGNRPVLGNQCWLVPDCSPQHRNEPENYKGYMLFSKAKRRR